MLRNLLLLSLLTCYASVVKTPAGCTPRPCLYVLDTAGTTADATENQELQTTLDDAERGDTIELTTGKIWTATGGSLSGSYDIYDIAGSSGYLTIRSTAYANLPPAGTRITPSHAANMARLQLTSSTNNAMVRFTAGAAAAQYVRFVGIEFYNPSLGYADNSGLDLVRIGNPGTISSAASLPDYIEFYSCYMHANTTSAAENRNAILANGKHITIQDSWISEIKMGNGVETHAVVWYDTPGPVTITNTWLEASSIPILVGGGPQTVLDATMMPADSIITSNIFYKPLKWYERSPDYTGVVYLDKNMIEYKIGVNNLIQYNSFYNNFHGQTNNQNGQAYSFNIRLPDGCTSACASFAKTDNTLFRDNILIGSLGVYSVLGADGNFSFTGVVEDFVATNNLAYDIGCTWDWNLCVSGTGPRYFADLAGGTRLSFSHETMFGQGGASTSEVQWYWLFNESDPAYPKFDGFTFENNIGPLAPNKWRVSGGTYNENAINDKTLTSAGPVSVQGNAAPGQSAADWNGCTGGRTCGSQVYPSEADFNSNAAQLWRNPTDGDFTYQTASAYRNNGLSGALMGADMSTIPRIYGTSVLTGSSKAVLSYRTSPILASQGCTLEVSTSDNLITSLGSYTVVTDVDPSTSGRDLQSRTGNVQDAYIRYFVIGYNSSLTASTEYFYRVVCGPTFTTGSFTTSASSGRTAVYKYATARTGEYSSSADMSSPTAIPSSTTHSIPISAGAVVYYRQTGGPIIPLV